MSTRVGVVDLRQYTVVPGRRDVLVDLFDRYFVEGQEAVGIHVVGQFRDLDDADRFVWLRGFESMAARGAALPRFYYGPVWKTHGDDANATMFDSDNALLLEPLDVGASYPQFDGERTCGHTQSVVAITVAYLDGPIAPGDRAVATQIGSILASLGAEVVAILTTHHAENNFPPLALRDEHVLVWVTRFPDDAAHAAHQGRLANSDAWHDAQRHLAGRSKPLRVQRLRLRPSVGSQLR